MKQTKTIFATALVLVSVGLTSMVIAAGAPHDGKATVRSVHGDVQYQVAGGEFKKLRTNMELTKDTVLKSGADGEAYLQVNGFTSTVKLSSDTTMTLEKMEQAGGFIGGDSTTDLKLEKGTLLGSVRKISANSEYNVKVPNGVAGIRGTDFQVTVTFTGSAFSITFTSVTGQVTCTVNPPAGVASATQNLQTGQSWTVSGTVNNGTFTTTTVGTVGLTPQNLTTIINTGLNQINNLPPPAGSTPPSTTTQPTQPTTNPSDTGGSTSGSGSTTTTL